MPLTDLSLPSSSGGASTRVIGLRCRECGADHGLRPTHVCEFCFGPLDVVYDYEAIRRVISRERIEAGPTSMWWARSARVSN